MVEGGPIDVLTGDWLAELTMLILAKNLAHDPRGGYARTFVTQMEQVMGDCLDRGIKVVSNAGGLSPNRCAEVVASLADTLGLSPVVAFVEGDDLIPRLEELREQGVNLVHMETGAPLGNRKVLTANAYLGGWGIAKALAEGADIVITGRVTDAALAIGPAAWHHGWARDDWDALAGAVVAGHVIECGAQATGGNYSFFTEIPDLVHPGFPIAEVGHDGCSVITKHPGHGGGVTVGTVTAQLLYEIASPAYYNPDVTARFDTIHLEQEGTDRVLISGVKGLPPPPTTKVAVNYEGGFRSTTSLYLTGLNVEEKAALVEQALWSSVPGGRAAFDSVDVRLLRTSHHDPDTNERATSELRITVRDHDENKVGRAFSTLITELGLSSYPGFYSDGSPARAQAFGVYWPALVPTSLVFQEVVVGGGRRLRVECTTSGPSAVEAPVPEPSTPGGPEPSHTCRRPLGCVVGARSGDKGGNANLGVWARSSDGYSWLAAFLTVERLRALLPEVASLEVTRYQLPNILALNFVISGLLGEGVAATARPDAQAKSLGEWLRARVVDIPEVLVR